MRGECWLTLPGGWGSSARPEHGPRGWAPPGCEALSASVQRELLCPLLPAGCQSLSFLVALVWQVCPLLRPRQAGLRGLCARFQRPRTVQSRCEFSGCRLPAGVFIHSGSYQPGVWPGASGIGQPAVLAPAGWAAEDGKSEVRDLSLGQVWGCWVPGETPPLAAPGMLEWPFHNQIHWRTLFKILVAPECLGGLPEGPVRAAPPLPPHSLLPGVCQRSARGNSPGSQEAGERSGLGTPKGRSRGERESGVRLATGLALGERLLGVPSVIHMNSGRWSPRKPPARPGRPDIFLPASVGPLQTPDPADAKAWG